MKTIPMWLARRRWAAQLGALACCLMIGLPLSAAAAAQIYDLNADWSDTANPNGPWSYREGSNALSHVADWQGLSGDFTGVQPAWARAETGTTNLPAWFKIASPAGIVHDWQLGDIVTHTTDGFNGIGGGLSNVIWTSPLNGTIDVAGGVWMGRDIGRGNHWEIALDGVPLTGGDIFSGDAFDRANPFNFAAGSGGAAVLNQIPVVVGDVLRLQFTKTSDAGDYVGVNLTITAVPEPAGIVLGPSGFFILFAWWRRPVVRCFSGVHRPTAKKMPATLRSQAQQGGHGISSLNWRFFDFNQVAAKLRLRRALIIKVTTPVATKTSAVGSGTSTTKVLKPKSRFWPAMV